MANITAVDVKKLRDATGAGMMDSKNALVQADGDLDQAVEILRIKGEGKARRRGAERTATAGLVATAGNAMVELNSETDFVAKSDQFQHLGDVLAGAAAAVRPADRASLAAAELSDGRTVERAVSELAAVIGEKIELGRVAYFDGKVATYMHRRASDLPPAVGVLVQYDGDDLESARVAAMQVAAMRPQYVSRDEVPDDVLANERKIAEATAREEGKPEQALERIIEGRVNGFLKEVALLEQPSVKDPKKTVQQVLADAGVTVTRFARFEVGQG